MKIIIDGQESAWSYDGGQTLEEVVCDINERLAVESRLTISEIKLDGCDPSLDMELTWDQVAIDKITQISVMTEKLAAQTSAQLSEAARAVKEMSSNIKNITDDLSKDRIDLGMSALKENVEGLIIIFDIIKKASALDIGDIGVMEVGDDTFNSFMERFNITLTEIYDAMSKNDATLIKDFLEYELEPAVIKLGSALAMLKNKVDDMAQAGEEK